MSCQDQQEEELEVLQSIYDGDECFREVSKQSFQYKIGEDGKSKSFLVEINWNETYPEQLPDINLNTFYNKHLLPEVKISIKNKLLEEAENLLGCAMTYTLFEFAKESADDLLAEQPAAIVQVSEEDRSAPKQPQQKAKTKERKEQLTKAQKRKMTNRLDRDGELPRGHDWVDVVKHLSQTGKAS